MIESILKMAKDIALTCGNCTFFHTKKCEQQIALTKHGDRPCNDGLLIQLFKTDVLIKQGNISLIKPLRFITTTKTKNELNQTFEFKNDQEIEDLILHIKTKATQQNEPKQPQQKPQEPENPETTAKATALLKDPSIIEKFIEHQNRYLCLDENVRKLLLLTCTSAYGDYPLNLSLQQVFSAGKTTTTTQTAKYFPNVWFLGALSPKALIHSKGAFDEEKEGFIIDLQGKILVFLDEPQFETLTMLKPLLSHDTFESEYRFVDKESGKTALTILKGWPSVIFCTTKSKYIMEFSSRWLTASPQTNPDKIRKVITAKAQKASQTTPQDTEFEVWQQAFKILSKEAPLKVAVPYANELAQCFRAKKPIDMRFFELFLALIKGSTILHSYQREKDSNGNLKAQIEDYNTAYKVFHEIERSTTLGLGQNVIDFFQNIIEPLWQEHKNLRADMQTLTYEDLIWKFKDVTEETIARSTLREAYLKPLEQKGLIDFEDDPKDKRKKNLIVKGTIPESSLINQEEFANKYCGEGRVEIYCNRKEAQNEPHSNNTKSNLPLLTLLNPQNPNWLNDTKEIKQKGIT